MHEAGFPIPYLTSLSMPLQELMEHFRAVFWEPEVPEPLGSCDAEDAEGSCSVRWGCGAGLRMGARHAGISAPAWRRDRPSSLQVELPGFPGVVSKALLGSFATLHHFFCAAESL